MNSILKNMARISLFLAISVGAKGTEIEQLAAKLRAATQMNQEQARKFLTEIRN